MNGAEKDLSLKELDLETQISKTRTYQLSQIYYYLVSSQKRVYPIFFLTKTGGYRTTQRTKSFVIPAFGQGPQGTSYRSFFAVSPLFLAEFFTNACSAQDYWS